jgi:hypothetical protein
VFERVSYPQYLSVRLMKSWFNEDLGAMDRDISFPEEFQIEDDDCSARYVLLFVSLLRESEVYSVLVRQKASSSWVELRGSLAIQHSSFNLPEAQALLYERRTMTLQDEVGEKA